MDFAGQGTSCVRIFLLLPDESTISHAHKPATSGQTCCSPILRAPVQDVGGRTTKATGGRTTGFTVGAVVDVNFDGFVTYARGLAWFENQVVVHNQRHPFSLGGDSGSLIVNEDLMEPVALLFAGDGNMTLANPIDEVLNEFNVTIVNG